MIRLIAMLIAYKWAWKRAMEVKERSHFEHVDETQLFRSYYDGMYRWLTAPIFGEPTGVQVVTKIRPGEEMEKGEGGNDVPQHRRGD